MLRSYLPLQTILRNRVFVGLIASLSLCLSLYLALSSLLAVQAKQAMQPSSPQAKEINTFSSTRPYLVKNINTNGRSTLFDLFAVVGDTTYFTVVDNSHRYVSLWKSNGDEVGTVQLGRFALPAPIGYLTANQLLQVGSRVIGIYRSDTTTLIFRSDGTAEQTKIVTESASSPMLAIAGKNYLYFGVKAELWRTDGTGVGTVKLMEADDKESVSIVTIVDDRVYNLADGALWSHDGTPGNKQRLLDLTGHGYQGHLLVDKTLFVVAGYKLWRTEGTIQTTQLLRQGFNQAPVFLATLGNKILFSAGMEEYGKEVWASDGTLTNTILLTDVASGPASSSPFCTWADPYRGLFYSLYSTAQAWQLWKSDGSVSGTQLVRTIVPSSLSESCRVVTTPDYSLFLVNPSEQQLALWRTDGTSAGTERVHTAAYDGGQVLSFPMHVVGTTVLFLASKGEESTLWRTDGRDGQTYRLSTIYMATVGSIPSTASLNDILLFQKFEPTSGSELWRTDGTLNGTQLLKTIAPQTVSRPMRIATHVGQMLYFVANDGVHGDELWITDGVSTGTHLVKDITIGEKGSNPYSLRSIGRTLYFGAFYEELYFPLGKLWQSDGSTQGTQLAAELAVKQVATLAERPFILAQYTGTYSISDGRVLPRLISPNDFHFEWGSAQSNHKLIARGSANDHFGYEPWVSDGTPQGTHLLKDIAIGENPIAGGFATCNSEPQGFVTVDDFIFFSARDGGKTNELACDFNSHGRELWRSDGTETGTQLVKDIHLHDSSDPSHLVNFNGLLFFQARDAKAGVELWRSDGSSDGTLLVKDINPSGSSDPMLLTVVDKTLFFVANDGLSGLELWKSDGTRAGTVLLRDIIPGIASSAPHSLTAVGNLLFFVVDDGSHGMELWKSDGTTAGTLLVADLNPGKSSSHPSALTALGHTLFFAADDGTHGVELWETHGNSTDTRLVSDINPGSASSFPAELTPHISFHTARLFFSADNGIHGAELWALDVATFDFHSHLPLMSR